MKADLEMPNRHFRKASSTKIRRGTLILTAKIMMEDYFVKRYVYKEKIHPCKLQPYPFPKLK